ncbi:Rhodanese domain protein [Caenispirillum salinarum AK4]|uniref:Rhodanese domain protein n=1 Tax=Caenispirillum salinarum AK4 TaxID=1238182 RepID=K9HQU6_9PROT|nr:rhodanese-like domain-containing protein [Caenispirillum salinarum]EKV30811.1 Rhodanese domain protein [Caenispirillum salinarum AK4]
MQGEYHGDVTPQQAWDALSADSDAVLIDVRTQAEWTYVGLPDLTRLEREPVLVEWQTYPDGRLNPDFLAEVRAAGVRPGQALYMLCRSGVRSARAGELLAGHGYHCFNIQDGFEGQLGPDRRRGVGGWKTVGLPWRQG